MVAVQNLKGEIIQLNMVIPIYPLSFVCGGYKNNKYHTVVKSSKIK
jgi:hypothetical protein